MVCKEPYEFDVNCGQQKKKRQKKMGMMNYKYKSYYFISVVFKVIH